MSKNVSEFYFETGIIRRVNEERCSMSTSSVSSVRFLLLATATTLLTDVNARAKLYWGYKLVKAFPRSHADLEILSRLKYMGNVTVRNLLILLPSTLPHKN
ncbi:uncharacterized protein LOC141864202 [Acropora palmata]|uniref:uncharacterized protein LOC141864202 n=1 Tax=Acropora palmata TaxID=6131 RepID=UPI003D9FF0FE